MVKSAASNKPEPGQLEKVKALRTLAQGEGMIHDEPATPEYKQAAAILIADPKAPLRAIIRGALDLLPDDDFKEAIVNALGLGLFQEPTLLERRASFASFKGVSDRTLIRHEVTGFQRLVPVIEKTVAAQLPVNRRRSRMVQLLEKMNHLTADAHAGLISPEDFRTHIASVHDEMRKLLEADS
jgi:hypothetical protein